MCELVQRQRFSVLERFNGRALGQLEHKLIRLRPQNKLYELKDHLQSRKLAGRAHGGDK